VLAEFPDAKVDEAKAAEWAQKWTVNWDRRFPNGKRGPSPRFGGA
jgi:hypothetical protein